MVLSPTTTTIVSPAVPLSTSALPYCVQGPTVVPGVVGETITYLPAY
jgi:hypothetical protein